MRYAARKDDNHAKLRAAARRCGAVWLEYGPLDAWVYIKRWGTFTPVEVKRPDKEGHKREFTPAQQRLIADLDAIGAKYFIWRTEADVIRDIGGRL